MRNMASEFESIIKKANHLLKEGNISVEIADNGVRYYNVGRYIKNIRMTQDGSYSCPCQNGTWNISKAKVCSHVVAILIWEINNESKVK